MIIFCDGKKYKLTPEQFDKMTLREKYQKKVFYEIIPGETKHLLFFDVVEATPATVSSLITTIKRLLPESTPEPVQQLNFGTFTRIYTSAVGTSEDTDKIIRGMRGNAANQFIDILRSDRSLVAEIPTCGSRFRVERCFEYIRGRGHAAH